MQFEMSSKAGCSLSRRLISDGVSMKNPLSKEMGFLSRTVHTQRRFININDSGMKTIRANTVFINKLRQLIKPIKQQHPLKSR
jgi:hypothetical protein